MLDGVKGRIWSGGGSVDASRETDTCVCVCVCVCVCKCPYVHVQYNMLLHIHSTHPINNLQVG